MTSIESDFDQARKWLEAAGSFHDGGQTAEANAAALIGGGYTQLAAVARWGVWRDEDLARIAEDREAERENDEVVRETNRLVLARERAELTEIEVRTAKLAELDAATLAAAGQREARAAEEARPHDDEALSWRTEDGGIAAVMCSDCHTLGGHDDDCPRLIAAEESDRG